MITTHWSAVLNFLIENFFVNSITTCIIWNDKYEFQIETHNLYRPILNVWPHNLDSSFNRDVYNFTSKERELKYRRLVHDDFIKKLTVAIEHTHCESFIIFQEDIPVFRRAFYFASTYSIWRSLNNKFLFVYSEDLASDNLSYFDDSNNLFYNQPNIIIVEAPAFNSSIFKLKTSTLMGNVYAFNHFDAVHRSLMHNRTLFENKLHDLQGYKMIVGIFDYKPFMVLNSNSHSNAYDRSENKSHEYVLIDGTDVRVMITFCELRNCTIQAKQPETMDWGDVYDNATATGLFGMTLTRQIDYSVGGMYLWHLAYMSMDITHFLGRSGVTCLVPAPTRLISWSLPIQPFQINLWICVSVCLILEIWSLCFTRHFTTFHPSSWSISFKFACVTSLKLFINQSTDYSIKNTSVRLILLTCYMIDLVLTSIYGGGLAAILTLPTLQEAADSRQRLYEHKLIWTGTSEAWTIAINGDIEDPVTVGLLKQFRVYSAELINRYSKTENMGFIVERLPYGHLGNSELIDSNALSRLKLMVDDIYFAYYVAYVPRLWPFLETFNKFVLAWHSSGFDKYWEWKIAADYMNVNRQNRIIASKYQHPHIGPIKLDMNNFMGLFLVWFLGISLSLIAFIVELFMDKNIVLHGQ